MTHQSRQNKIEHALDATLKSSELENIAIDFSELGLDSLLSDGVLRDIPVINTLVNLMKVGANVQDQLFLKKILAFLSGLKEIPPEKREQFINDIDNSKKYRVRVGEKILYIIDSCEDFEIAELVSKVFKYYLEKNISYEEFLKTSSVLKDMNKVDFDWFVKERKSHYFDLSDTGDLMHTGLFELYYEQIDVSIEKEDDYKVFRDNPNAPEYKAGEVDGGVSVHLSRAGEILLEIFCETYQKPKSIKI